MARSYGGNKNTKQKSLRNLKINLDSLKNSLYQARQFTSFDVSPHFFGRAELPVEIDLR